MAEESGIIGQITNTPVVDGYDCILANIIKSGTSVNMSYDIAYADLSDAEKQTVQDFTQLIVDNAPVG